MLCGFPGRCVLAATLIAVTYVPVTRGQGPEPERFESLRPNVGRLEQSDSRQIRAQIAALGSPKYIERESASAALIKQGLSALESLREAQRHPDREIRQRATRALQEILIRDRPRRLALLRQGVPMQDSELLSLPGWQTIVQFVEEPHAARHLLAEALEQNWEFLEVVNDPHVDVNSVVSERCLRLLRTRSKTRRTASRGDIVAVMLGGLLGGSSLADQTLNNVFTVVHHARPNVSGDRSTLENHAFRKLAGELVLRSAESNAAFQGLNLSMALDLEAGLESALRILERQEPRAHVKVFALMAAVRFGQQDQLDLIEDFLQDSQVYHTASGRQNRQPPDEDAPRYTVQVRDVALACALHLRDRDLSEMGFARAQKHPKYVYNPSTLGFASASERDAAFSLGQRVLNEHAAAN